jgi:hypothetical protein
LKEHAIVCNLLKIQISLHLEININAGLATLQSIEESGHISGLRPEFKIVFYETKALANKKFYELLLSNLSKLQVI